MPVKLRGWRRTLELVAWGEPESAGMFSADAPTLTRFELRAAIADEPSVAASLRAAMSGFGELASFSAIAELDDDALCDRVLDAIERGRLRVRVHAYEPMASHPVEVVAPASVPDERPALADTGHWIEIELLDDEDQPVVGERCRVVLPDEREVYTQTDRDGLIRIDPTVAGMCQVYFPDLDHDAVAPLVAYDDWIELALLDDDDQPVIGERCRIVMPDGREVAARSDRKGVVRVERCVSGECEIYFPDLDADVVAALS
ncbi:hypothetical protein G6O69_29400 [Pseudenhygromyxa sp. WMMC2535]|uniref:hypothetical protein n=1 Tax=Pseudenhygromyxa sp. WMMC2535 TaxID=2712867 RepID=UPI0015527723|nr:hypothetical protein [Pseudenhygromyxa sp. WMMC2535]NVB41979.1 hypothetical protein [Pseudenhygromyxa sp. WMMC2535]